MGGVIINNTRCVIKGEIWEHSYWGGGGFQVPDVHLFTMSISKALYLFFTQHWQNDLKQHSGCLFFFSSFLALATPPLQTHVAKIIVPQEELVQLKGV